MNRPRDLIAGGTDYTGISIEVIIEHLGDWCKYTSDEIQKLKNLKTKVTENSNQLNNPKNIIVYITYFQDLFERYLNDLQRVEKDIKKGVRKSHIETLSQIYSSSKLEDNNCVNFKRDNIEVELKDEIMRPLLDNIYSITRTQIIDYKDLSNVVKRLEALVDDKPIDEDIVDVKPNFFGLGLNFNAIFKRFKRKK